MRLHTAVIAVATRQARELCDITREVREEVRRAGVREGLCALYAQGATAALMIQENADPAIRDDVLDCLARLIPAGQWRHDRIDDNGAAHIQAGLIGPSATIPVRDGQPALSTWQNVFLCELDGPRHERRVLVTVLGE
jgi:secondary thiamine-phosphate synthase enzyme